MCLHLALWGTVGGQQGRDREKISKTGPLPRKGLFPGTRARLWGDDLQQSQKKGLFMSPRYLDARQAVHNTHCNAGTAGRDCSHVPGAHKLSGQLHWDPRLEGPWSTHGQGEENTHRPRFGASGGPVPRSSPSPSEEEQPQHFCQPHANSICFWGTFVPNLSPVSWSYYKQVQSALPLLFR